MSIKQREFVWWLIYSIRLCFLSRPFSFGVPTSFSGQSSNSSNSSSTTSSSSIFGGFGTASQFPSRPPTSNNSFTTTSPFGTNPFSSTAQTSNNSSTTLPFGTNPFGAFRPTGGNLFTSTSPFGTSSCTSGQTSSNLSTTLPFGTGAFRPTGGNSFTTQPVGISPFSTGQTSSSHTTSPFSIAPPNPFSQQPNNSWTTSPFTMGPSTTSPCGTAPFSFQQPSNSLTTSPTRFPSTGFPFTSSMISTPTTSPSNVSVFAPFSSTSIQGTRQKPYELTGFYDGDDKKSYEYMLSISAVPCYKNKSHEELRLEDYTLTGKAGTTTNTVPNSSTSWPFGPSISNTSITPNSQPISQPVITPFSAPSFVPPTSNTYITPNIQPISQPVIPPFQNSYNPFSTSQTISTTVPIPQPVIAPFQKSYNPFSTSQTISTTVPNSTTGAFQDSTVPLTSIPPTVSQDNNQQQQHVEPSLVSPMMHPFTTVVRHGDTLPIKPFQYGISCLPVIHENPKPAPKMPLVNVRHLSMGRRRLPIEKYKPIEDEKRVPFFEELGPAGIYKKGAGLIPRENPRSWVVLSCEKQSLETESSELSASDHSTDLCNYKTEDSSQVNKCVPKTDHKDPSIILAMIPKLRSPEYYMEPSSEDLAANELKRPGFCCKVKDFMIGRRNYSNIKFIGETDVRNLDVESIVQFANREVEVYKDEKDKPRVGQGLNKAAEITLLNIKCIDKSTGMHCIDGPRADKFKKLLISKAMKQGSEFVSYDPVKGEWRFKVEHF